MIVYRVLLSACLSVAVCTAAVAGLDEPESLGTALYTRSDAAAGTRKWTDDELTVLRCRVAVESLVPARIPDNANDFLEYFGLVKNHTAKIRSAVVRKRVTLTVADAFGAYLYAKLLPTVRMLYYEGKVEYPTAKRLHDLMKHIKFVLDTDGRGWARPMAVKDREPGVHGTKTATRSPVPGVKPGGQSTERCGGVDAGPYGLSRRRRWSADDDGAGVEVPYLDNNARPHSLVVPWRPGRPVLYSVQDAGCHRALYDHCARTAGALSERHVRALREWLNATVTPLVTSATGRWYPALWGARLAARQLDTALATAASTTAEATTTDDFRDYYADGLADGDAGFMPPNGNFYATIVLVSTFVWWTAALCALSLHR